MISGITALIAGLGLKTLLSGVGGGFLLSALKFVATPANLKTATTIAKGIHQAIHNPGTQTLQTVADTPVQMPGMAQPMKPSQIAAAPPQATVVVPVVQAPAPAPVAAK